jgi:hypothetical protein
MAIVLPRVPDGKPLAGVDERAMDDGPSQRGALRAIMR